MSDRTRGLPSPDFSPPRRAPRVVAVVACRRGAIDEGEQALRPLREFGPPVLDQIAEADHRLATMQQLHGIDSSGNRHDVRGHACDPDTTPATSCILVSKVRSLQHFQAIQWIT